MFKGRIYKASQLWKTFRFKNIIELLKRNIQNKN